MFAVESPQQLHLISYPKSLDRVVSLLAHCGSCSTYSNRDPPRFTGGLNIELDPSDGYSYSNLLNV
jgi:hypothetical protein